MPKNDSGDHIVDVSKMVRIGALHTVASQFMQIVAVRFAGLCSKFKISEEVAGALLTGALLLDEPANAEAFVVAWSDVYAAIVVEVEAEHGVTLETDCYYVEVVDSNTGESVLCSWEDGDADDRSDQ